MTDAGPRSSGDHGGRACVVLALVLLVPASLLAGCVAEPDTQLRLRQGDLARVELVVWNGTDVALPADAEGAVAELCEVEPADGGACPAAERAYALRGSPPAQAPDAWADARPLPGPLVSTLEGLSVGDTVRLTDALAFGPYRETLVETHPLEQRLSRFVDDADAYGRTWNTTVLDNGTHRIEPGDANGTTVQVDRWCNERFCLFESTVTRVSEHALVVEHGAREGQVADVDALDTRLAVTDVTGARFTVDGNPARAGERYDVFARVTDARGPPEGADRAPGFELTALDGSTVALADLLGKPVVLEFFATWCPSCAENADHLKRVEGRFGDRVNIVSIGVDPWEEASSFRAFIQQHNITWPVTVDETGDVSQAYGVGSLSTEVLVSPSGAIVHTETGVADHDRVVQEIEDLLGHGHGHGNHDHEHDGDAGAAP